MRAIVLAIVVGVSFPGLAFAQNQNPGQAQQQAAAARGEPSAPVPTDPLAMSAHARETIGTDYEAQHGRPEGKTQRSFRGYYEERKGDYRFRMFPPLYFESTRGLLDPLHPELGQDADRESLVALFYYQRRSRLRSADVLFPIFWHLRDDQNYLTAIGPFLHQEGPGGHDNWLAPLFFSGTRHSESGESGYAIVPPLLTFSQWSPTSSFTLSVPALYFRNRSGSDVDAGVVPFYFHGDNGNVDGNRQTYTLIPPLLFYHSFKEFEQSHFTVAGPFVASSTPYRAVFDVLPFFFHIEGKPETGGERESHTTFFPLFHYGRTDDVTLVASPLFVYRKTHYVGHDEDANATTIVTPVATHLTTRNGATKMDLVGPVVPLYISYVDKDVDQHTWALLPLFYRNTSHTRSDWATPLFGRFQSFGQSRTYWVFPTFTATFDTHGYETAFHPILYVGRNDESHHAVLAPIYWDFADKDSRLTIGFPLFWRFANHKDDSVVEVAGNVLYTQKRTAEGKYWSFHFLPLFSYGESPTGYFWNFLMGLAGFEKTAQASYVKALWLPIKVASTATAVTRNTLYEEPKHF